MKKTHQKGFSLVELLVVVVIMGIVSTIAIPSLLSARRSANEASAISFLRALPSAQELYFRKFNQFATSDEALVQNGLISGSDSTAYNFSMGSLGNTTDSGWYGKGVPLSEVQGRRYFYISSNSGGIRYTVGCCPSDASTALGSDE